MCECKRTEEVNDMSETAAWFIRQVINFVMVVLLILIWNGISDSDSVRIKIILAAALILVFGLAVCGHAVVISLVE